MGDVVIFDFLSYEDSVTQSSFEEPCIENGPFDTGFFEYNPMNPSRRERLTVELMVTTTSPQWFFSRQNSPFEQCSSNTVFAINPGLYWGEYTSRAGDPNAYNSQPANSVGCASSTASWWESASSIDCGRSYPLPSSTYTVSYASTSGSSGSYSNSGFPSYMSSTYSSNTQVPRN